MINFLALISSVYSLQVLDKVVSSGNFYTLFWLTIGVIGIHGMFTFLSFLRIKILTYFEQLIRTEFSEAEVAAKFQNNIEFTDHLNTYTKFLISPSNSMISFFDSIWSIFFLLGIFMIHPNNGFLATFGILFIIWINSLYSNIAKFSNFTKLNAASKEYGNILSQINNVNKFSMLKFHVKNISLMIQHLGMKLLSFGKIDANLFRQKKSNTVTMIHNILQSLMYANSAILVIQNKMTFGGVIATSILFGKAAKSLVDVVDNTREYKKFLVSKIFLEEFEQKVNNDDEINNWLANLHSVSISVKNLYIKQRDFYISSDNFVIKDLNLTINKDLGNIFAFCGQNFSGKSLIIKAIAGELTEKIGGSITINNMNIYNILNDRIRFMSYYDNSKIDFKIPLCQYISRFDAKYDQDEVDYLLQTFNILEYIKLLSHGYDTIMDYEFLHYLPSGIFYRLSLASAFYKKPKLIVLNELNSISLDKNLIISLQKLLSDAKDTGSIVIMEAVHMELLKVSDYCFVIERGGIKEQGKMNILLNKNV